MEQPGLQMQEVLTALAKILATQNEQQQEMFLNAIKEMKKPSPEEQAKLDQEKELKLRRAKEQVELGRIETERREATARGCPHATEHPGTGVVKHTWRAQIHAPAGQKPYFVPTCGICLTQLPKIPCTTEMLTSGNGVQLERYRSLDMAQLLKWADAAKEQVA